MIASALVIGHQVGSKTLRDALFLSSFPANELPKVMAGAAAASLVLAVAAGRLMRRFGPYRLVPIGLVVNACVFVLEALLLEALPRVVALGLYLHVASLGALLVSGFWSVFSERFDPHTAKALVGRIGAGATLGGVLGALMAEVVARTVGTHGVMLALSGISLCAAAAVRRLRPAAARRADAVVPGAGARASQQPSALGIIRARPYLATLAALTLAAAVWEALLDYAMKASAAAAFSDRPALVSFFAAYYTGAAVVTFIVQMALCSVALRKLGLTWTVALLPGFVVIAGAGTAGVGALAAVIALRTGEGVLSNSLYRAGHELYFTPLSPRTKRPTKTLLDIAATRVGDGLGALLVFAIVLLIPGHAVSVAIGAAALTAACALLLMPGLHGGYVAELERALRSGVVALDASLPLDATTQRTLSHTIGGLDRSRVLAEIEALPRSTVLSKLPRAHALGSKDDAAIRRALAGPLDPALVPLALPLLLRPGIAHEATKAIEEVAARASGALLDAMLDAAQPSGLRALVPRLLEHAGTARARDALIAGLEEGPEEVRAACARALLRMTLAHPELRPASETILRWVSDELARMSRPPEEPSDEVASRNLTASLGRLDPGVTQALTLLSIALDREALSLAERALASDDLTLRGTAIEYLENVVAEPARTPLLARLLETRPGSHGKRSEGELRDALFKSSGGVRH